MRKLWGWEIILGVVLITLCIIVYLIHFFIFRDPEHIFLYFFGDFAFVFFELLLVTLVIHRLLHYREQKAMRSKLNMLIGAFFSEVGTELLRELSAFDESSFLSSSKLTMPEDWSEREFLNLHQNITCETSPLEIKKYDFEYIKSILNKKKPFLLDLIQNPCLLEDETFTNLVWAIFHLTQELIHRKDLKALSESDYQHLLEDTHRVHRLLIGEWMYYMKHLRENYPFLFSLADRTNPFKKEASVEVK